LEQQYKVSPLLPAVPVLQLSDESCCEGVLLPVHEKP
jgi:hypothetical protein